MALKQLLFIFLDRHNNSINNPHLQTFNLLIYCISSFPFPKHQETAALNESHSQQQRHEVKGIYSSLSSDQIQLCYFGVPRWLLVVKWGPLCLLKETKAMYTTEAIDSHYKYPTGN